MKINRDNLKWLGRMMSMLLLAGLADGLVVQFVHKPFPWVVLIPALIPLLTSFFVILPLIKAEKPVPPGV